MPKLDSFTSAYVLTALWSSTDDDGTPLDQDNHVADIAPATLANMIADCAAFQAQHGETIQAAIATGDVVFGPDFDAWGRAGHDFWLTRNGHGAGFWDGDWPEPMASILSKAARAAGGVDLYVGYDGQIHA